MRGRAFVILNLKNVDLMLANRCSVVVQFTTLSNQTPRSITCPFQSILSSAKSIFIKLKAKKNTHKPFVSYTKRTICLVPLENFTKSSSNNKRWKSKFASPSKNRTKLSQTSTRQVSKRKHNNEVSMITACSTLLDNL